MGPAAQFWRERLLETLLKRADDYEAELLDPVKVEGKGRVA
jgi:hypothetical protein